MKIIRTLVALVAPLILACSNLQEPKQVEADLLDVTQSFVVTGRKTIITYFGDLKNTDLNQFEPTINANMLDGHDSLIFNKETKNLLYTRSPYKKAIRRKLILTQVSVTAEDSLKLDKSLLGYRLVGIFENPLQRPNLFITYYVHPQKRDILSLTHMLKIGRVINMTFILADSINPVKGHEAEVAHFFKPLHQGK